MSAGVRVLRSEAIDRARELVELLDPVCERLALAGSLRRKLATIGDLDLVCVPRFAPMRDLFGETFAGLDLLACKLDDLCGEQVIRQRRDAAGRICWGPRYKRGIFRDLPIDVTSCDAESFGLHVLIRTGPSAYAHQFVTPRSQTAVLRDRSCATVGTRPGLLPPGFEIKDGFRLYRAGAVVATPNERDVYDALDLPYVEPWERR
jgi:DNA polymerase/3'-5' exonuclease PolX